MPIARRPTGRASLTLVLAAVLVAASTTSSIAARPAPPDVVVEVRSISYEPSEVTVPRRTLVRWENVTSPSRVHDVVSSIPDLFESGRYGAGDAFTHRFDAGGTFTYICSIHDVMIGAVHVPMGGRTTPGAFMRVRLAQQRKLPADSPFRFLVHRREPGSTEFVRWRMTRKAYLDFVPTAPGTHRFVMRIENVDAGQPTGPGGDSPILSLEWPG